MYKSLFLTTFLFLAFIAQSQERNFRSQSEFGIQTYDGFNLKAFQTGILFKDTWMLELGILSDNQEARNLPSNFRGEEPKEHIQIYQVQIGHTISIGNSENFSFTTKLGMHTGWYNGVKNFAYDPFEDNEFISSFLPVLGSIINAVNESNHTNYNFRRDKVYYKGINGEMLIEYWLLSNFAITGGANFRINNYKNDAGLSTKLLVLF